MSLRREGRSPTLRIPARRLHLPCRALFLTRCPSARTHRKFLGNLWPVVKRRGIEIGAVRPYQRADLRVERNRIESGHILQWAE
jgi:hypothetical protein